jgi:DNA-binding response OmpR family regulator
MTGPKDTAADFRPSILKKNSEILQGSAGLARPMLTNDAVTVDVTNPNVLVVEDEAKVRQALSDGLTAAGYHVTEAVTGEDAFYRATTQSYDLVVLDVMLPQRSGVEVLAKLRHLGLRTPVLLLTARDSVDDRVLGLDAGADDYLVKPFAFPELLARLRALMRRGRSAETHKWSVADLELDTSSRTARRGQTLLDLTPREFELLEYLLRHAGQLVSREMLARDVWKEPGRGTSLDNVIDVHMARMRKKIDADAAVRLVHTVRGVGFVLREGEP